MPVPRPQIRRAIRRTACASFAAVAAACLAVPLADGRTVEFTTTDTSDSSERIELNLPEPKLGVTGTVKFRTSKVDRRALKIARNQQQLEAAAVERSEAATRAVERIAAIEELLADAQEDQQRLEAIIQERLVDRYKEGDAGSIAFLLSGDGLADLVSRGRVLEDQSARDRRTFAEYEATIERIELHKQLLEELSTLNGEQASNLRERAERLDQVLVATTIGHDEAPPGARDPKGVKGTWYVMDGAFTAQLFVPGGGSNYGGGTHTPARKATQMQIAQVLNDTRIDLDASGYQDVLTGQIDGRLLDAMMAAAQQFGSIKITSLKGDHGTYTASGNVSEHAYGCAMDIGTIGSTYITPGSQTTGGEVYRAVLFFNGLGAIRPDLGPHQVISLFDLGGATLAMGDHGDHIHVGYSC